jgi:hypothetical protein
MDIREIDNLVDVDSLEKAKLKMDFERIRIDRLKIKLTAISILIPLLLGVGTVFYGILVEDKRAKTNFEIKAVEIVLGAENPTIATHKAIVLYELFPDHLPNNFKEEMVRLYGR